MLSLSLSFCIDDSTLTLFHTTSTTQIRRRFTSISQAYYAITPSQCLKSSAYLTRVPLLLSSRMTWRADDPKPTKFQTHTYISTNHFDLTIPSFGKVSVSFQQAALTCIPEYQISAYWIGDLWGIYIGTRAVPFCNNDIRSPIQCQVPFPSPALSYSFPIIALRKWDLIGRRAYLTCIHVSQRSNIWHVLLQLGKFARHVAWYS